MKALRLGGVPLHPLLVHFPVVAWSVLPALDLAVWSGVGGEPQSLTRLAFGVAAFGAAAAVPTMAAGLYDLVALDAPRRELGLRHMLWMGSAFTAALVALVLRALAGMPPVAVLSADLVTLALLAVGGHLGAQLVYRHGAGVVTSAR